MHRATYRQNILNAICRSDVFESWIVLKYFQYQKKSNILIRRKSVPPGRSLSHLDEITLRVESLQTYEMEHAESNDAAMDVKAPINEEQVASNIHADDENESDSGSSIGIPLISVAHDEMLPAMKEKVERPPDGLQWNDTAIVDCWNVAIHSHDSPEPAEWQAPSLVNQKDMELLTNWRPKSMSIPIWAVDPFSHSETSS